MTLIKVQKLLTTMRNYWVAIIAVFLIAFVLTTKTNVWAQDKIVCLNGNSTVPVILEEGGAAGNYALQLCKQPDASVTVTLRPSAGYNEELIITPSTLDVKFDSTDWDLPVKIIMTAIDDNERENSPQIITIEHSASSEDPNFNFPNANLLEVPVHIIDNERTLWMPLAHGQPIPTATPTLTPTPSWQRFTNKPRTVDVIKEHNGRLFIGGSSNDNTNNGIYTGEQCAEASLTRSASDLRVYDLAFRNKSGLAATNGKKVYYSTDGGLNWQQTASSMNAFVFAVTFINETLAYAGTDDGVYKSTTNGKEWRKENPSRNGPILLNAFTYDTASDYLWIATYGNGVWRLKPNTTDFEQRINGLPGEDTDQRVWDILIRSDNEIYIATANGVYRGDGNSAWRAFGLQGDQVLTLELVGQVLFAGVSNKGVQKYDFANSNGWGQAGINQQTTVSDLFYNPNTPCNALLAGTTEGAFYYK